MTNESPIPFKFLRITADPSCNLACLYCNPHRRYNPDMMSTQEVLETVRAGVKVGIPTAHLTGGEPTKRSDIVSLVAGIKNEGVTSIEMTTNGVRFHAIAEELVRAGLTGVNISLDTFNGKKFEAITQVDALSYVHASIDKALQLLKNKVAINMVVIRDNLDEIQDFIRFSREKGVMVRFCELTPNGPYMKDDPNYFEQHHVPKDEILAEVEKIAPLSSVKKSQTADKQNAHSEYYTMGTDALTVGVIAPYSNGWPCPGTGCTRLRIGPTSANSCVIYPDQNLKGLPYDEKLAVIKGLIDERNSQMSNDLFPETHNPAYALYRFGSPE